MARNWHTPEDNERDHGRYDERGYHPRQEADEARRAHDEERGAYGAPARMSRGGYGSDFGASDPRASWSGMDETPSRGRRADHRERSHEGRRDSAYPPSGLGAGRTHDYRSERYGASDPHAGEWGGRRPDWGRQEWGMSGPQQDNWAYDREQRGFLERASDEVASWFGDEEAERRRQADQYRGRGPKNYSRSDERIREDVSDRLTDDGRVDASDIEIAVANGEVTLTGTVDDRMQRRRAEDVAEWVSGVRHVQNNLRVRGTGATPGTSTEPGASEGMRTAITPGQASNVSSRNA